MGDDSMTNYEGSTVVETQETRAHIPKVWGEEEVIVNTPEYCGKILRLQPGAWSSLHYHDYKDETFLVVQGVVAIQIGDRTHVLIAHPDMDSVRLVPKTPHRFWAIDDPAVVIEFSMHHSDGDVTRLEESGRLSDQ